ncbi:hypothetical protein [Seonamhaeicola marinus]|uniref:Uncharacterized protein n=1 Tax=Seonamhaeicola marinus TaxID=1912246 RepID=A0A5D0IR25_9FLAO|nr:hypothetical protein [Seonamhaeicola marinus]TYA84162.1 hypothetical protein FUA24_05785 [Seonamhaeicola marinus]
MKMFSIRKKVTVIAVSIAVIIQSCTVYKAKPISLKRASEIKAKVKVITNAGNRYKYRNIISYDGNYYGIQFKRSNKKVLLNEEEIKKIKVKDSVISVVANVLLGCAVVISIFIVGYNGPGLGDGLQFPN